MSWGGQPHYPLLSPARVSPTIRVLLVEDNEVYRSSLELLLGLQPGLEVVGAVGERRRRRRAARSSRRPSWLMDYRLPGLDGAAATPGRLARPRRGVVCLTAEATRRSARRSSTRARSRSSRRAARSSGSPTRSAPRGRRRDRPRATRLPAVELTRPTTAIVLDSTSDFVDARERHANMRVVPLYVLFDGEPLRDQVDIPGGVLRAPPERHPLPTTSQPTPADFVAVYEELVGRATTRIWSLHLSAKLSGTFASAGRAAEQIGGDIVRVVDTGSASLAVALLAEAIDRRLERGSTDEQIEELVDRFLRDNGVVFTVGTLEYLQKGGRIGKGQALAGSLLNVKPILSVEDGVIIPIARVRGRQKALKEFEQLFTAGTEDRAGLRIAIAHAKAPEWIVELTEDRLADAPAGDDRPGSSRSARSSAPVQTGAVGFFWFQDEA